MVAAAPAPAPKALRLEPTSADLLRTLGQRTRRTLLLAAEAEFERCEEPQPVSVPRKNLCSDKYAWVSLQHARAAAAHALRGPDAATAAALGGAADLPADERCEPQVPAQPRRAIWCVASLLIGAELWKNSCCQLLTDLLVWQGCAANRTAKTARRRRSGTRGCGCGRRRSRLYSRCPTCCRAAARASCATPRSPAKVRRGRSSPHDSPWRGVTHTCSRNVPWQAATVWRCGRPRPAPTARPRRSCRWPRQLRSGEGWRAISRRCPRSRLRRVDCMCRR